MGRAEPASTRERILAAAGRLFRARGLNGVSIRQIAAAASSDPALVIRHFDSKESLFLRTMQVAVPADPLFSGPLDGMGRACIRLLLDFEEETRSTFLALLRSSGGTAVDARLKQAHEELFVAPLLRLLSGPDAALRASLAASLVGGLLYSMWVAGDEVLLAADRERLVEAYGALLQQLITPAL